jgi:hypothetical protein
MTERATVLRSMHDTGLAAWFGGSLMGAVGLNGAAAQASNPGERLQIASAGWDRWAPVNAAAIGTHLVGAAGILVAESPRVAAQRGVGAMSVAKTALTAAALAVTGYARVVGKKMENAGQTPTEGTTEPAAETPAEVSAAQRQQRVAQWMIPVFTGALLVISALAGEQQKPQSVLRGITARVIRSLTPSK